MAKPQLEILPTGSSQALVYKIDRDVWPVYHYHPEFDILLSLKDHAGEFVSGDHVGRLGKGTLIMNGPNIPHALHSGGKDENDWSRPSLAVIQFSQESLGKDLLHKREMQTVREFLDDAKFGFEFHGRTSKKAAEMILAMKPLDALERLLTLLRLLHFLASSSERIRLASPAFSPSLREADISRLDDVLGFIRKHRTETITLAETARVAKMTPKSFCRFFKANTGKTLIEYLHELRIGEACRLLLESDLSISQIAFECGFNNLSNFNRRFRDLKKTTPREFRRRNPIAEREQDRPLPPSV